MTERKQLFRSEAVVYRSDRSYSTPMMQHRSIYTLLVYLSMLLGIAAVALLVLTNYSETEKARGILEPSLGSHNVVSPVAAVVQKINVEEGQVVRKGEVLALLSTQVFDHRGNAMEHSRILELRAQEKLLEDEARLLSMTRQQDLLQTRNNMTALQSNLDLIESESELIQQQLQLSKENQAAMETLAVRAAISKSQLDKANVDKLNYQLRLQENAQRRQGIQLQLDQEPARQQRKDLELEFSKLRVRRELQELNFQIDQLTNQSSLSVVAEAQGQVAAITTELGQALRQGQPLFTINTGPDILQAFLYVPSRLVGRLYPGQPLMLSYDGFDKQQYGRYRAVITRIARASIDPRQQLLPVPSINEPVFRVEARLAQAYVEGPDIFRLQAGNFFDAEIVMAEMSLLAFIFRPLLRMRSKVSG